MATKAKRENGSDLHFASLSSRISRWVGGGKTQPGKAAEFYNAAFPVAYNEGVANLYESEANPSGSLVLCRAENKLQPLCTRLSSKMRDVASTSSLASNQLGYQDYLGTPRLRGAVAAYASRHLLVDDGSGLLADGIAVSPDHLAISAGCGVVIENLCFALLDAGDSALVPSPYYGQFARDLGMRAGIGISRCSGSLGGLPSVADLEAAWTPSSRLLLLTNPSNPTGLVSGFEELIKLLHWAQEKDLHVLSDEIYARSVYDTTSGEPPFVSLLNLVGQEEALGLDADWVERSVSVVFGFSKDFGASGLRIGVLHTRNRGVLSAWNALGYSCAVSSQTQALWSRVLEDEAFVDDLVRDNCLALNEAASLLKRELRGADIKTVGEPTARLFFFIDLRDLLAEPTFEAERKLWRDLVEAGVVLNAGELCGCPEPGYFRLCFAWMRDPERCLPAAVRRISSLRAKRG